MHPRLFFFFEKSSIIIKTILITKKLMKLICIWVFKAITEPKWHKMKVRVCKNFGNYYWNKIHVINLYISTANLKYCIRNALYKKIAEFKCVLVWPSSFASKLGSILANSLWLWVYLVLILNWNQTDLRENEWLNYFSLLVGNRLNSSSVFELNEGFD